MMQLRPHLAVTILALFTWIHFATSTQAQDYTIEKLSAGPDEQKIGQEFQAFVEPMGYAIKRGGTRTVAEIWFAKKIPLSADFTPSPTRLYPFEPTQLVGVIHFPRRISDFRDQEISSGWYTLRFNLQPIDGNHIGTSPTRDFLVLVDVEQDDPSKQWSLEELNEAAAETAGSSHPAILCLQPASDAPGVSVRHDEQNDWWILHLFAHGVKEGEVVRIPVDVVIDGHGPE